jgi:hypothetical protein
MSLWGNLCIHDDWKPAVISAGASNFVWSINGNLKICDPNRATGKWSEIANAMNYTRDN